MKLYFPHSHINHKYRRHIFPLLKPFIKGKGFSDTDRVALYGVSINEFHFERNIEGADLVILPMSWNYYVSRNALDEAKELINKSIDLGLKVLVYNAGDAGISIPFFSNVLILQHSAYRKNLRDNEFILPPFIKDPLKILNRDKISFSDYKSFPTVGFCGLASTSINRIVLEWFQVFWKNLRYHIGYNKEKPQALLSVSKLRNQILNQLEKSSELETHFIRREKYRAGVTTKKELHKSTFDFYRNIEENNYTVCARGVGNFSNRFYECLAMGRIPAYAETDGVLPFENIIDWKKHIVFLNTKDEIDSQILNFHKAYSEETFQALQESNRRLWESHFTLGGFFKNYFEMINGNKKHEY